MGGAEMGGSSGSGSASGSDAAAAAATERLSRKRSRSGPAGRRDGRAESVEDTGEAVDLLLAWSQLELAAGNLSAARQLLQTAAR